MKKMISLFFVLLLVGCTSTPVKADIDFQYKTFRLDVNGDAIRGTNVCVRSGLFGRCKEWQYQIIERHPMTPEFIEKLRTAGFVIMAMPDLLQKTP